MRHAAWITGKGWSMLVSLEDSYRGPNGYFTGCQANEVLPHLLCYAAWKEGIEKPGPDGGYASYRETGTSGRGDCAGP